MSENKRKIEFETRFVILRSEIPFEISLYYPKARPDTETDYYNWIKEVSNNLKLFPHKKVKITIEELE